MTQKNPTRYTANTLLTLGALFIVSFSGAITISRPAQASCAIGPYLCETFLTDADSWWQSLNWTTTQQNYFNNTLYQNYFVDQFYEDFIIGTLWEDNVLPAMKAMTGQLIAAGVDMTGMVGGFFDGAQALETQLTLQELQARAIKDYTPGENLCRLGTGARSLALSDEKVKSAQLALAQIAQNRLTGSKGSAAGSGRAMDRQGRFKQFQRLYCDPGDNNGEMKEICGDPPTTSPPRFNKDIDFARTVDSKLTLNLDLSTATLQDDEEDVLALSSNLYGHDVFDRIAEFTFKDPSGQDDNEYRYLDVRQVVALRSVALNSFNAITGMRAKGAAGSSQFLRNALRNLGMSDAEAKRYIGDGANIEPSYYAQMEVLTKKLYQDPNFYVNLIDKPAEVARVQAAMQGFGLMNNWEIAESARRQEMLLSVLLELEVREAQTTIDNSLSSLGTE